MENQVELQKQNIVLNIKVWVIIQTYLDSDCLMYPPKLFNNLLHFNDFILETNVWIIHKQLQTYCIYYCSINIITIVKTMTNI